MKCPRCNGEGSVPYHIADDLFDETNCTLCGGSGEVMTNEEWLRSCNRDELVTLLYRVRFKEKSLWQGRTITEWLKEVHHAD